MGRGFLTSMLETSMTTLFLMTMRDKLEENDRASFSNKGSAKYLPKQTYKNKLKKNRVKR